MRNQTFSSLPKPSYIVFTPSSPPRPSCDGRTFERLNAIRNANTHYIVLLSLPLYYCCYYFNNIILIRTGVYVCDVCVSMRSVQRISRRTMIIIIMLILWIITRVSRRTVIMNIMRVEEKYYYIIVKRVVATKSVGLNMYKWPRPGDVIKSRSDRCLA